MPANRVNPKSIVLALTVSAALLILGGCAGQGHKQPVAPDDSVLAPAQQALDKARAAHADDFAPRAVDAARRRIATARDILYTAARAGRQPNDTEQARVDQLVEAARLDARSALNQTQARAVAAKIEELQGQTGDRAPAPMQGNITGAANEGELQ